MSTNSILASAPLTSTNYILKANGTTIGNSLIWDNGTNVGIGNTNTSYTLDVSGTGRFTSTLLVSGASTLTGAVGIGIAAPSSGLEVYVSGGGPTLRVTNSGTGTGSGNGFHIGTDASSPYNVAFVQNENASQVFYTNNGTSTDERMRILASGGVMVPSDVSGTSGYRINYTSADAGSRSWKVANDSAAYGDFVIAQSTTQSGSTYATKFTINPSGNVGIGTTSPSAKLTILRSGSSLTTLGQSRFLDITDDYSAANARTEIGFGYTAGGTTTNIPAVIGFLQTSTASYTKGDLYFATRDVTTDTALTERMRITSGGYTKATNSGSYYSSAGGLFHEFDQSTGNQDTMWIYNTASSGYGLTINMPNTAGNGTNYFLRALNSTSSYFLYSNGSSTFSSDRNLKKNIETTRDGYLEDLMHLRVVKYNWNTQEDGEAKELGLIAQEVAEIFPSLVVDQSIPKTREIKQEDGSIVEEQYEVTQKGLKVSVLPFILLKAIQELQEQINELKNK